MKTANKGFVVTTLLLWVLGGVVLFFVPNPLSSAAGIGVRPNKTVEKDSIVERVEFIKDENGVPYATKTTTTRAISNRDIQQKVGLWEQLRSLPVLWLFLMVCGCFSPVIGGVMGVLNKKIKDKFLALTDHHKELEQDARKIINGLDLAFASVALTLAGTNLPGEVDRALLAERIIKNMKKELGDYYNDSTKELVRSMKAA